MARRRRPREPALGRRLRRRSARVRLTALYCALFLPSGVALAAITYVLIVLVQRPVDRATATRRLIRGGAAQVLRAASRDGWTTGGLASHATGTSRTLDTFTVTLPFHVVLDAREFFFGACVVLVAMIGVSLLLGWFVAGRVLRPLRVMTATTRRISERNLHERLALGGPDDELKDLGETIDGLLTRLEAAFDSQRRFVANASHELRTPLMLNQTLLQVALADPAITLDSLRAACEEVVDAGKEQAQLIDALVTLARSQRGLERREPVDLTAVVEDALRAHGSSASARGLSVDAAVEHAEVSGDARLLRRLVSNLVDNAVRYNVPGGRVEVMLATDATGASLTVANTGPLVPAEEAGRLLEPFRRASPDRTAGPNGLGLGLSIVADIAAAHGAGLEVRPRPEGGLRVAVRFAAGST